MDLFSKTMPVELWSRFLLAVSVNSEHRGSNESSDQIHLENLSLVKWILFTTQSKGRWIRLNQVILDLLQPDFP